MTNVRSERLIGVDLLKVLVLFPIVHFHINEFIFRTNEFPLLDQTFTYAFFYPYCKFMSFSGFSIVLISFFLFGLKNIKTATILKLIPIFILGQILVNLAFAPEGTWFYFEWDIYSYLAVACLLLAALRGIKNTGIMLAICFGLLVLPYREILSGFPNLLSNNILFSYCLAGENTTWALVPWALLPSFGFFLGRAFASEFATTIGKKETVGWGIALAAAAPYWGDFYEVPVGYSFYCFVFNRSTPSLWAHLLIIIFGLRLSVVSAANTKLVKIKLLNWISSLMWCRKFWLCYIIQVVILGISARFADSFMASPKLFDLFYFTVIPLTEILCRALLRARLIFRKIT